MVPAAPWAYISCQNWPLPPTVKLPQRSHSELSPTVIELRPPGEYPSAVLGEAMIGEHPLVGSLERTYKIGALTATEAAQRLTTVESLISQIAKKGKLYGRHFDDLLALKYLHQRYTNYVSWLGFSG